MDGMVSSRARVKRKMEQRRERKREEYMWDSHICFFYFGCHINITSTPYRMNTKSNMLSWRRINQNYHTNCSRTLFELVLIVRDDVIYPILYLVDVYETQLIVGDLIWSCSYPILTKAEFKRTFFFCNFLIFHEHIFQITK